MWRETAARYFHIIISGMKVFSFSVQQSSIYGLAGVLPGKWYTQAIMAGESAAGMTVAISRVITKASVANERFGAIAFFIISLLFILLCIGCQVFLRFSPFVTYHMKKFQAEKATIQVSFICFICGPCKTIQNHLEKEVK